MYQLHEASLHFETYEEALEAIRGEAQRVLDEQVQKLREAGGTVAEAHLRIGERRDRAIVHLADELGAGLIVMGSRGLGVYGGRSWAASRIPWSGTLIARSW